MSSVSLTSAELYGGGGQLQRLVCLVKRAFDKTARNSTFTWSELQDVLLDVEVALSNCPLSHIEDDTWTFYKRETP